MKFTEPYLEGIIKEAIANQAYTETPHDRSIYFLDGGRVSASRPPRRPYCRFQRFFESELSSMSAYTLAEELHSNGIN